jgi:hypothetical protein
VPASSIEPVDLLDLKLLPAWVNEEKNYAHYQGDEGGGPVERASMHPRRGKDRLSREAKPPRGFKKTGEGDRRFPARRGQDRQGKDRHQPVGVVASQVVVHFLPRGPAVENVAAQIKSGSVAYSLFALARLFLEKPERYGVRLAAKPESPLYQLGESGAISPDQQFLESNAFRFAIEDFYKIDITQSDPIKGNFSNVARCKLSGTLLGPTNHHDYQRRLRNLYEQRFSRRMSFADYQRQIEIVNDPAAVEQWKEEARKVTTFTTVREETPATFASAAEAERHFRQNYLPGLIRTAQEIAIDGVLSRRLPDRGLHRAIEDAWTLETRSPSKMMQELGGEFREAGLNIFRHRRGMLFVSPIRARPLVQESAAVSSAVSAILEALRATPGINRKELAEKLIVDLTGEELERTRLALASDLHWLVGEGYVIEFNDGSLDLPRTKAKAKPAVEAVAAPPAGDGPIATATDEKELAGLTESRITEEAEIGGG